MDPEDRIKFRAGHEITGEWIILYIFLSIQLIYNLVQYMKLKPITVNKEPESISLLSFPRR